MAYDRDADQRARLTEIVSSALVRQGWTYEKGPGFPIRREFATRYITEKEVIILDIGEIVQRLLDAQ